MNIITPLLTSMSASPITLMVATVLIIALAGILVFIPIQMLPRLKGRGQEKRLKHLLNKVLPQYGGTVLQGEAPVDDTFYACITLGSREIQVREYEVDANVTVSGQVDSTFVFVPFEQDLECVLVHKEMVDRFFRNYNELETIDCETLGISDNYILFSSDLERARKIITHPEFATLLQILDGDYKNSYLMLVPTSKRGSLSEQFAFHFSPGLLLCRVGLCFFLEQKVARTTELVNQMVRLAESLDEN